MDRAEILRLKLQFYQRRLREGVVGPVAQTYLQEIAKLRTELQARETGAADTQPSDRRRLEWSDTFLIGHPVLDAEHRDVLDRINKLCSVLDAKQKIPAGNLHGLLRAVELHFEHEIAIIKELTADAGAPDHVKATGKALIESHASQDKAGLSRLRSITDAVEHSSADARPQCAEELIEWFVDHAINSDAILKTVFQPTWATDDTTSDVKVARFAGGQAPAWSLCGALPGRCYL